MNYALALIPLVLLVLGLPVYLILLTTCAVAVAAFHPVPMDILPQLLFGSVNKVVLISLPFFILAGEIMAQGGIARRIVDVAMSTMGGVRGSLGLTAVASCTAFGAVSGSSPATVAAIGGLLYEPLRRRGYGDRFSSSLLTSCGGIAIVIPPSISMILYGASSEQSVPTLFIAGIIPGLLIAALVGIYVYFHARGRHEIQSEEGFSWSRWVRSLVDGWLALLAPLIILGGIYLGIFTPTEAGGIACVYGALVGWLVYRAMSLSALWLICIRSAHLTARIFIVVAAASVYSWLLTIGGIPVAVTSSIESVAHSAGMTFLLINVFLLVVGCFIDPTSAIIVLTPLLVPLARHAGINLIHLGIVMVVNLEIGMFTPPFGLNIFVAQTVFRVPLRVLYPGLVPFIGVNLVALLLITYVPWFALVLTRSM